MKLSNKISIYTDGGARGNPGWGAWAFKIYMDGELYISQAGYMGNFITNNEAEYSAVLEALKKLRTAVNMEAFEVTVYSDSKLIVNQLEGLWEVKAENLREYFNYITNNFSDFGVHFKYLPRSDINIQMVDDLVNKELDERGH